MFIVKATGLIYTEPRATTLRWFAGLTRSSVRRRATGVNSLQAARNGKVTTNYLVQSTGNEIDKVLNVGVNTPVQFIDNTSHMLRLRHPGVCENIGYQGNPHHGLFQGSKERAH